MKKKIEILILVFIISNLVCFSQKNVKSNDNGINLEGNLSEMPRILIMDMDGKSYGGLYFGETDENIYIINQKKDSIPKSIILSIRITKKYSNEEPSIYGLFAGIYLGNLLFYRAEGQPNMFLAYSSDSEGSYSMANLLFGLSGAGLAALFEPLFRKYFEEFNFSGEEIDPIIEWLRFKDYTAKSDSQKLHISFEASKVYNNATNKYIKIFENLGFYTSYLFSDNNSTTLNSKSNFNLMRNLFLSYSLYSRFELGVGFSLLSEPTIVMEKTENLNKGIKKSSGKISLNSNGYFITGNFKPDIEFMPEWLSFDIGSCLGISKVNFNINTVIDSLTIKNSYKSVELSKIYMSLGVNSSLYFNIYPGLNLGIIYDYCYIPGERIEDIPIFGIPSQVIDFGNSSLGAILRFNF